ncbi:MAG: hypothetical protein KGQ36_00920 [Rickettsiales bacterium]|nr:hypothetical protein [Rickettsiales bacterium]
MKKFFFAALCFFILADNVFANQPDQASVNQALANLLSAEGKVTKAQYDEFWQQVGVKNNKDKEQVIFFMKDNFLLMQDYQKETWQCAEDSWKAGKVTECSNMKKKLDLLQASFKKIGQESAITQVKEASDYIVKAAAKHGQLELPGAPKTQMSLELIQKTKANLNKIFEKFSAILRVNY